MHIKSSLMGGVGRIWCDAGTKVIDNMDTKTSDIS